MGREIRRVPADWEHPRYTKENAPYPKDIGEFIPLFNEDYDTACEKWYAEAALWQAGKHPDQADDSAKGVRWFHNWNGGPPDKQCFRARKWTVEEATHYQVYETVSEGSPVTPHFATKAELIDYLVNCGDFWDQKRGNSGWSQLAAEQFVEREYAPSLLTIRSDSGTLIKEPRDERFREIGKSCLD